jgi:hypothetical protein
MICVDWYGHDRFELFYRHCDGYPTGLGIELIDAMLKHDSIEDVLNDVSAEPSDTYIEKVEDAFLKVRSDLEWIYVIRNAANPDTMSLEVYKTSCPYTKRNFVWPVWFGYKRYMERKKALWAMLVIEMTASNTLHALHEFEKAGAAASSEKLEHAPDKEESQEEPRANNQKTNPTATTQEELAHYTACVFEPTDIVEIRRLPSGKSTWHQAGELAKVTESLVQENQRGQHIYVGANSRRVRGGTRSKDVACARCLFVDFDEINPDEAGDRWHNAGLPTPTITIASGHGVHAYWRLVEPIADMALWSKLQKKLIALLDSDAAIHDPARIMRLPGFTNHKEPVAACRIIDDDKARICDLKSLMPLLNSVVTESERRNFQAADNSATQPKQQFHNNISVIKIAEIIAAKWPAVSRGGRNSKAFQNAAYLLKNLGLTEEQAWPILQQWNRKNRPPLPERELRQALRNAAIYGRHPVEGKVAG